MKTIQLLDRLGRRSIRHTHSPTRAPNLDVQGRELVRTIPEQVGLEKRYHVVVARHNQLILSPSAAQFVKSAEFGDDPGGDGVIERLHPMPNMVRVVMDPLRQFGDPVVRSVPTRVIADRCAPETEST